MALCPADAIRAGWVPRAYCVPLQGMLGSWLIELLRLDDHVHLAPEHLADRIG